MEKGEGGGGDTDLVMERRGKTSRRSFTGKGKKKKEGRVRTSAAEKRACRLSYGGRGKRRDSIPIFSKLQGGEEERKGIPAGSIYYPFVEGGRGSST